MNSPAKRRWKFAAWFALIGLLLLGWFLTTEGGNHEKVSWLSQAPPPRPMRLAFLGRWMWPVKSRLQRVKYWLAGTPRLISVSGTIMELDPSAALTNLPPVAIAFTNPAGGKVFVVKDGKALRDWAAARPKAQVLSNPSIMVSDGMQAQISTSQPATIGAGTNLSVQWVGFWLDVWPRLSRQATELTCFLASSERVPHRVTIGDGVATNAFFIRTNAAFGVRALIPEQGSMLIVSDRTNANGKITGAVLSPAVESRKGK